MRERIQRDRDPRCRAPAYRGRYRSSRNFVPADRTKGRLSYWRLRFHCSARVFRWQLRPGGDPTSPSRLSSSSICIACHRFRHRNCRDHPCSGGCRCVRRLRAYRNRGRRGGISPTRKATTGRRDQLVLRSQVARQYKVLRVRRQKWSSDRA